MGRLQGCDVLTALLMVLAFALPLSLLVPNFTIWDVLPKIQVYRCHVFTVHLTWPQLNATLFVILFLLFCLDLEVKKRKMDDMVEMILRASNKTEEVMSSEQGRQTAAVRVCVKLLDANTQHYENLMMLSEDLRARRQRPPAIESSIDTL